MNALNHPKELEYRVEVSPKTFQLILDGAIESGVPIELKTDGNLLGLKEPIRICCSNWKVEMTTPEK